MSMLGGHYEYGLGVEQDYTKAREWYEKSATLGEPIAMQALGLLYVKDHDIPKDDAKAREWLGLAASAGDAEAKRNLENFDFLPKLLSAGDADVAGNHREAKRLRAELAREIEADERRRSGKSGRRTAEALAGLAWEELFVRNYSGALDASVRAHSLAPDVIWYEGNHAHALMFLGRVTEARELYLSHEHDSDIGLPFVGLNDRKSWRGATIADFAEFRSAGLTHPLMDEVQTEFTSDAK
jgi:TPR repeat protein